MYQGIADYLEIMKLAGVSELKNTAPNKTARSKSPTQSSALGASSLGAPVANAAPLAVAPADLASLPKAEQLRYLAEEVAQCTFCTSLASSRTQTVFGVGNPDASLVFLGEAPGVDEDKQGEPFVGRAGQLLTDIIEKGMQMRREDVYICNILRCRPPGNRNPMPDEAEHCRPFLDRTLNIIKPKYICCLGAVAAQNLLNTKQKIGELRGEVWDYNSVKVVCTYHPAYLLRNPAAKKDTWDDIKILLRELAR